MRFVPNFLEEFISIHNKTVGLYKLTEREILEV